MEFVQLMERGDEFDRSLRWVNGALEDANHRLLAIIIHGRAVKMERAEA